MFTIKEYNQQLNKSYDSLEYFKRWSDYRCELYKSYGKVLDGISSLCIVGAGFLNDICIDKLLEQVIDVTLIDIDGKAIKAGLGNHHLQTSFVNIIEEDITSLDDDHFFEKIIYMLQADDLSGIRRYLSDDSLEISEFSLEKEFDGVLVSSIYTQLLLSQYTFLLGQLLKQEQFEDYLEPFMYFISKVIRKVNSRLLKHVKDDGVIICFSDILEYDNSDSKLQNLIENIGNKEYVSLIYDEYIEKYGHGLGSYGIEDLKEQMNLIDCSWHIWPFDAKRTMLVKMVTGTKKVTA
ncbi:MAG: hypothetical protein JXQ23_04435 [Clostridia bacterium]|nr:hypothetical protein [Clostridia bacterium]